jgi:hypothetical protein
MYVCMYENNSYQSYAPFYTLNLQNVWFPDDSPWMKSQIDSRYGILVYLRSIYVKYDNDDFSTIPTRIMPLFVIWICYLFFSLRMIIYERKIRLKLGAVCKCILWISRVSSIMTIFRQFLPELCPFLYFKFAIFFVLGIYLKSKSANKTFINIEMSLEGGKIFLYVNDVIFLVSGW